METSNIKKTKGNYVFPNILANLMRRVSFRTQIEAEMMSIACILLGLFVMAVYTIFFTLVSGYIKFLIGFNAVAGFVLLSSRLITSFQQYQTYLASMGFLEEWNK